MAAAGFKKIERALREVAELEARRTRLAAALEALAAGNMVTAPKAYLSIEGIQVDPVQVSRQQARNILQVEQQALESRLAQIRAKLDPVETALT